MIDMQSALRDGETFHCTITRSVTREEYIARSTIVRFLFAGLRLPGSQQGVRLFRIEISECEGRGAVAESEESYRTANRRRRGAVKIRLEG